MDLYTMSNRNLPMPWSSEILLSATMAPEFILSFTDAELQCDLTALHKGLELFVCGKSVIC